MIPAPPTTIEIRHLRILQHMWRVAQGIIQRGLDPLLARWPHRGDEEGGLPHPGVTTYPAPAERPRTYSPLAPRGRLPRIWNLSNTEIKQLWPQLDPELVRRFAPWAVTYEEVRRLSGADGSPTNLQERVRRAIEIERQYDPRGAERLIIETSTRAPEAFRLRYPPEAVAIFGRDGVLPPPPRPMEVNQRTIERQLDWIRVGLETQYEARTIEPAVRETQLDLEEHSYRQARRVLAIDLDASYSQAREERMRWMSEHVELIESGIRAPYEDIPLRRQSLFGDVQQTITQAYEQGLRVEVIAGGLQERYGVSEARAQLLAVDQVLKANGRLARYRQESIGGTEYIWITARDRRVRETHVRLHNTRQSWANPPPVGGGLHEHPGGDYRCRCIAKPVSPAWLTRD